VHHADSQARSFHSCQDGRNCHEAGGEVAAICTQSIIPVIADNCGQSRTKLGLREVCKTYIQRIKLPKVRESAPDLDSSIRMIADRQRGTTFRSGRQPVMSISKRSRRLGSPIACPGTGCGHGCGCTRYDPDDVAVTCSGSETPDRSSPLIWWDDLETGGAAVDRGGGGRNHGGHPAILRRDEDAERAGHVRLA